MSKWYEVKVIAVTVFAVEVEDDEDESNAMEYATNGIKGGDISAECSSLIEDQVQLDSIKRHAEEVLSLAKAGK
jgi:hypothetical protein